MGGLAHIHWTSASWAPDTNYPFLVESLKMYSVPNWLPAVFYLGIIAWSLLSTLAFVYASVITLAQGLKPAMRYIELAFVISLTYWFAFFLADQLIMKFDLEENHLVQGGFQLLSFLAIYWLPSDSPSFKPSLPRTPFKVFK